MATKTPPNMNIGITTITVNPISDFSNPNHRMTFFLGNLYNQLP